MKEPMHPSGLPMSRWNWPFKTAEERKLVAAWFKKAAVQERDLNKPDPAKYGTAPF
jgi:hypothetical protein